MPTKYTVEDANQLVADMKAAEKAKLGLDFSTSGGGHNKEVDVELPQRIKDMKSALAEAYLSTKPINLKEFAPWIAIRAALEKQSPEFKKFCEELDKLGSKFKRADELKNKDDEPPTNPRRKSLE